MQVCASGLGVKSLSADTFTFGVSIPGREVKQLNLKLVKSCDAVAVEGVDGATDDLSRNRVKVPTTEPKERRTLPRQQDPPNTPLVRNTICQTELALE